MATRRRRALAKAGDAQAETAGYMGDQANEDRATSRNRVANRGLRDAKTLANTILKAIAHGTSSVQDEMKHACLREIATLAEQVRDGCRAAADEAESAPTLNEQSDSAA